MSRKVSPKTRARARISSGASEDVCEKGTIEFVQDGTGTFFVDVFVNDVLVNP